MKETNLDTIANELLEKLNKDAQYIVKGVSINSPRAVGDAV